MAGDSMVDFSFLHGPSGLDMLAQSIEQTGESFARRNRDKQERALKERDVVTREARESRMLQHDQASEEVENSKRRSAENARIRERAGVGDFAGAQQMSDDYAEVDPRTNEVRHGLGFKAEIPDVGPAPQKPPEGPTQVEEGPRATPEISRRAAQLDSESSGDDAGLAIARADAERERFAKANDPVFIEGINRARDEYPAATARYSASQQQAKDNAKLTIGGMTTTPSELRHSATATAAADFDRYGDSLQKELDQAHQIGDQALLGMAQKRMDRFRNARAGVEAGAMKPSDAIKALNRGDELDTKIQGGHVSDVTRGEYGNQRQRIANTRPLAPGPGTPRGGGGGAVDPKAFSAAESAFQHFEKQWNISADRSEDANLRGLLANSDKAIVQRAITSNLSRGLAREKGVLTDQDINRLQKNLGGAWTEVQNWFDKGATGELSPDVMAKLKEGIDTVLQQHDINRKAAKAGFDKTFGPTSPLNKWGLTDHIRNKRAEYFGDDEPTGGAKPGNPKLDDLAAKYGL